MPLFKLEAALFQTAKFKRRQVSVPHHVHHLLSVPFFLLRLHPHLPSRPLKTSASQVNWTINKIQGQTGTQNGVRIPRGEGRRIRLGTGTDTAAMLLLQDQHQPEVGDRSLSTITINSAGHPWRI